MNGSGSALILLHVLDWIKLQISGCAVSTRSSGSRASLDLSCGIRRFVMFTLLMAVLLLSSRPSAEAASFRVTNFINGTIGLHYYSKDNDLGLHTLNFEQDTIWHFGGMPWTEFWCIFEWDGHKIRELTWGFFTRSTSFDFDWWVFPEGLYLKESAIDPAVLIRKWQ